MKKVILSVLVAVVLASFVPSTYVNAGVTDPISGSSIEERRGPTDPLPGS